MKNTTIPRTAELVPHAGLRRMRVRADVSSPGQRGLGGATALINGRLSDISAAARKRSGMLESAIACFAIRRGSRQGAAELEQARVGWIAGSLHLFADSELETPA